MHLAALAVVFASPIVFTVSVAPAVLRLAPERAAAGALISAILRSLCHALEVAFAVLFFTTARLAAGPGRAAGRRKSSARALFRRIPALGFVSALAISVVVIPTMERIRLRPESDPGGLLFRRYHAVSTLFFAIAFLCAVFLLVGTVAASGREEEPEPIPSIAPSPP